MRTPVTTHEMVLAGRHESGAEDWHCPECGRRMLLRWTPDFQKVIVDRGDEGATHVGGRGGVRLTAATETGLPERERSWLRDNGIDWDGWAA